jgi:hypothetical protein
MQIYLKRGTMGKLREASDQIGDQFHPAQTFSQYTTTQHSERTEDLATTGFSKTILDAPETQDRTGFEEIRQDVTAETLFEE